MLATILLIATQATHYPHQIRFSHVRSSHVFQVRFTPSTEYLRDHGSNEYLTVDKWKSLKPVSSLSAFDGLVKITSKEAALELVRLKTSVFTYNLFLKKGVAWVEPMTINEARSISYGFDRKLLAKLGSQPFQNGIASRTALEEHGFLKPVCKKVSRGFLIRRNILEFSPNGTRLQVTRSLLIEELVNRNGSVETKIISKDSAAKEWYLFSLENFRARDAWIRSKNL